MRSRTLTPTQVESEHRRAPRMTGTADTTPQSARLIGLRSGYASRVVCCVILVAYESASGLWAVVFWRRNEDGASRLAIIDKPRRGVTPANFFGHLPRCHHLSSEDVTENQPCLPRERRAKIRASLAKRSARIRCRLWYGLRRACILHSS
jgi:hypothetical protein